MAVLVEGISVVIRADALLAAFADDWERFKRTVPNRTLCADGELVRVGFMAPDDVRAYVEDLGSFGLAYIDDGKARDLVVVDQIRGPAAACDWIEFGHVNVDRDPNKTVAACRLKGSKENVLIQPEGWRFEESLSNSYGFVPTRDLAKSLNLLERDEGIDVYENGLTGKKAYVGRTRAGGRT